MNTIQNNSRFIDLVLESGATRSLCKDYIQGVDKSSNSEAVLLNIVDDVAISLNYWEYGTIADPTQAYATLEVFYEDLRTMLNN